MSNTPNISKKDIKWMSHLSHCPSGEGLCFVPSPVVARLTGIGFVELHDPERIVLTAAGRRFLKERDAGEPA